MAKLSARGCTVLARATRQRELDSVMGVTLKVRDHLVLRSDNKVLLKSQVVGSRAQATYKVIGKVSSLERFENYAKQNGYVI